MKVVILAGGFGTRLAEETVSIPKPMVQIGQHPILWHIMKFYASYGFEEFVLALGYKAEVVKNFFLQFADMASERYQFVQHGFFKFKSTLEVEFDVLCAYHPPHKLDRDDVGETEVYSVMLGEQEMFDILPRELMGRIEEKATDEGPTQHQEYYSDRQAAYGDYLHDLKKEEALNEKE